MTVSKNTEHVAQALANLIAQFGQSTNLRKLVEIYVRQAQIVEDLLTDLLAQIDLQQATSAALDAIGAIVDEERNQRPDADFRLAIQAKILLIRSDATHEDVLSLVRSLVPTSPLRLISYFPAAFEVLVEDPINVADIDTELIARFIREGSGAGIGANVILGTAPVFRFDTPGQGFDLGKYAEIF